MNVSLSGAATYTMPITVSPGTNGMQPSIALSYSSQSGNGIAGYGWNISGLSAISRVSKNMFTDGTVEKIDFSNNGTIGKFAIDGNRLVPTNNTDPTEFATESGNTIRIYPKDDYSWFEVHSLDGTITEYGRTEDSRLAAGGNTLTWYINKITDPNGNYMQFVYGNAPGEVFIKYINYAGNTKTGQKPYASVEFLYQIRPDKNTTYYDGIDFNQTVILKGIKSRFRNTVIRDYLLDYAYRGVYLQLVAVGGKGINHLDEGENGSIEYNQTLFEYDKFAVNPTDDLENYRDILKNKKTAELPTISGLSNDQRFYIFGDFDGDGKKERITLYDINGTASYYLQKPDSYGDNEITWSIPPNLTNLPKYQWI